MNVPIPDFKALAQMVFDAGDYDLTRKEGCGDYTRAVCAAAHVRDARFLMLKKSSGQNHVVDALGRRHAVDAILFLESPTKGISIDIVGSSASAKAKPTWNADKVNGVLKYRYTEKDSFVPGFSTTPAPQPQPKPQPQPSEPAPPAKPRLTYGEWLRNASTVATELDRHRGGHAPTDIAHFLYGMVEEDRKLDAIVKEIRG